MKLVDTSSWIHQMRKKGDPVVRSRVEALLRAGEAAWCAMVRLEICYQVTTGRTSASLQEASAFVRNSGSTFA